jgi:carbonic anhydrase
MAMTRAGGACGAGLPRLVREPNHMLSRRRLLMNAAAMGLTLGIPLRAAAAAPATSVPAAESRSRLVAGNERFVAGNLHFQSGLAERRVALAGGQAPFASVLACSDSRVAPELVFDQNVGALFVARNAGNFVTDAVLGTLEYGYEHLGSKLIVVLGHESCGAISATYDALADRAPLPPHLDAIENGIRSGIATVVHEHGSKDAASAANARAQAARLRRSPLLAKGAAAGDLEIVAAIYHLKTGAVVFL